MATLTPPPTSRWQSRSLNFGGLLKAVKSEIFSHWLAYWTVYKKRFVEPREIIAAEAERSRKCQSGKIVSTRVERVNQSIGQ
jgi:hypothetical protein